MWELRAILCIPVYIITWQYGAPDQIVPPTIIFTTATQKSCTPVSSGVSLLHCTVQDEDVLVGCWNRRQQTHSLTGSSSKHWAKTDCLQRRLFNSAGKNYFPFIFSDWNSVDFCWWAVTLIYNCSKWGLVVTGCWLTGSLTAFNLLIISSVEPSLSLAVSVTLWPWHSTIKTELGES